MIEMRKQSKIWGMAAIMTLSTVGFIQPAAKSAPKVLKIVYHFQTGSASNPSGEWLQNVATQFQKQHPGVKVKIQEIISSEADYYTKLDLLQSSNSTSPDVVMEDTFLIGSDSSGGYLRNLTPDVKKWPEWQKFYASMKGITTYNGKVWGVPYQTGDGFLWYNKTIFKKVGLPTNWHPKTWAQVLQAAALIRKKDPQVIPFNMYSGIPLGEASSLWGFQMLLAGTGNNLYNYQTNQWVGKSPGFLRSLGFIQKVFKSGLGPPLSDALTASWQTVVDTKELPAGQVAINLDLSSLPANWAPSSSSSWPAWKNVMGYTAMPTENGQTPGYDTVSGGWALSISRRAQYPMLAWDFIKLATNAHNMAYENSKVNGLVTNSIVSPTSAYEKSPEVSFATKLLRETSFRPAFPNYPRVSYAIQTAMEEVMTGQLTPLAAMDRYDQTLTGIVGKKHVEVVNKAETAVELHPAVSK